VLLDSVDDATSGGIVRRDGDADLIAENDPYAVLSHFPREVSEYEKTGVQTYTKHTASKYFFYNAVEFDVISFRHGSYKCFPLCSTLERTKRMLFWLTGQQ
jgi:hypothetical protein